MTLSNGVHHLDWDAAYMLPRTVVHPSLLRGIWQMVWSDSNASAGWVTRMPIVHQQMLLKTATSSVHEWLKSTGCGQGVRAKKARLKTAQADGVARLSMLYEGQLVLVDGIVAEVRNLEKAHNESIFVLPYTLIAHETPSSSKWHLAHHNKLHEVPRSAVLPVDWTWNSAAGVVTVHMG